MTGGVRLAIIGEFKPEFPPHARTADALDHVRGATGIDTAAEWIATDELASQCAARLSPFDGVWIAPGSPYRSMNGALNAIRHCRETGLPLIGTCGGCQHVIIEFARNVLGIADAQDAEIDPYASDLIITPLSCSLVGRRMDVVIEPASALAEYYAATRVAEEYYCNFGLNPHYDARLHEGGLRIVGRDADGEARLLWLPEHPFFVASLFVPQLRSTAEQPHPLIAAFVRAAGLAKSGRGKPRAPQAR